MIDTLYEENADATDLELETPIDKREEIVAIRRFWRAWGEINFCFESP